MYEHNDGMTGMEREMRIAVNEAVIHRLTHKRTNADRIRAMSDDEMAEFLYKVGYNHRWGLKEYTIEWLQQPAEEDKHETD